MEICREIYLLDSDFKNIHSLYAWCIYYTEIKFDKIEDETKFLKAAKAITKLSKQEAGFSPYVLTVFKVLDYLSTKIPYPKNEILEWCSKLEINNLDDEAYIFTNKQGEKQEGASKQEQYFAHCTKALYEKGLYDECIFMCQKALESIETFHNNNAIWLARRISVSFKALGDTEMALELLHSLLQKKRDWFMYKEIAEIYFEKQDYQNGLKYAIYAVLGNGERDKKVNLYKLLAKILKETSRPNKNEEIKKHIEFIYFIRRSNNWKIDNELNQLINEYQIDTQKNIDLKVYEKELKNLWRELRFYRKPIQTGTIKKLDNRKRVGKIECENGKTYSFRISNFLFIQPWFRTGQTVNFYLEEGLNSTEEHKKQNAFEVRILE